MLISKPSYPLSAVCPAQPVVLLSVEVLKAVFENVTSKADPPLLRITKNQFEVVFA